MTTDRRQTSHLLISQFTPLPKHVGVVAWVTHKLAFKEGNIEAGGVVVDKLEHEHLHGQLVLIFQMGLGDLCRQGQRFMLKDNHE